MSNFNELVAKLKNRVVPIDELENKVIKTSWIDEDEGLLLLLADNSIFYARLTGYEFRDLRPCFAEDFDAPDNLPPLEGLLSIGFITEDELSSFQMECTIAELTYKVEAANRTYQNLKGRLDKAKNQEATNG